MIDKRADLMRRKLEVDDACREARVALQEAEGIAAAEGKYMPPREEADQRMVAVCGPEHERSGHS